jgi:two-component system chemotaxis response regulator CheB
MIAVLVVDDSAVVRQTVREILERAGGFSVVTAPDVPVARGRIATTRPDVIVLDIAMPGTDGLTFLSDLMSSNPIPVVICSARIGEDAAVALEALARGAVDVLSKPRVGVRDYLDDSAQLFVDSIRAAAGSRRAPSAAVHPGRLAVTEARRFAGAASWVIAMGASTGGTEALAAIFATLPRSAPGVLVVQHMPRGFTRAFAKRLDRLSALDVREAETGDLVEPGVGLIAPGGRHLTVVERGDRLVARLEDSEHVNRHRPSADVLFRSVAASCGRRAVGVLLTGMGRDGAAGLLEMRRLGARTLAQDEDTSVVFGMPREAIALGAAERVVPLQSMTAGILEALPEG